MKKLLVISFLFLSMNIFAQQKFALVIGNGNYTSFGSLPNALNDANDITLSLQNLGFTVDTVLDGNRAQIVEGITRLKNRLSVSKNSYGFLFYAGHGLQFNGINYLIPAKADIPNANYLGDTSISVQTILAELNDAGNELNIVVLDACRDFPAAWSRSMNRGLTVVANQPADSIIVYATSAGSIASDGTGRNGLFTTHLLKNLSTPGLEVSEIFRLTGADVSNASNRQQIPAIYNQFFGRAYLDTNIIESTQLSVEKPFEIPSSQQPDVISFSPIQSVVPVQPQIQKNPTDESWKNKWIYLGGGLAGGGYHWINYNNESINSPLFAFGFSSELALLPFFSIELDLALGFGDDAVVPVIPLLAKVGGRFAQIELFFDIGYTVGLGITLGGTFGFKVGQGIVFAKYLYMPNASVPGYLIDSAMLGFLGYKIGIGKNKNY